MNDQDFIASTADRLAGLGGVEAVALGGSRATGLAGPDSDWDVSVYYRGGFDPNELRGIGWTGTVSDVGEWGGGVFNGGAWLTIDGRRVDVHYRDLESVEHELGEARAGRVRIEPLLFHLTGIPTYLIVAELAINITLLGHLPKPSYPDALREAATRVWRDRGDCEFSYARDNHARRAEATACVGLTAVAATSYAHAIHAARGEWVTNDKGLLRRAGLSDLDVALVSLNSDRDSLASFVESAQALCRTRLQAALESAK